MNHDRLKSLLAAAAQQRLSDAEVAELARRFENPANRAEGERELAVWRYRLGVLLDYHAAVRTGEPGIPEARLTALVAAVTGQGSAVAPKSGAGGRHRWRRPAAAAAIAAGLAIVLWQRGTEPRRKGGGETSAPPLTQVAEVVSAKPAWLRGGCEFGVIAAGAVTRGDGAGRGERLSADWRVVPLENLAQLRAWTTGELPPGVAARAWVDEEAGQLRAVYRQADGSLASIARSVESGAPISEQVDRLLAAAAQTEQRK